MSALKNTVKYVVSLSLAGLLLWYVFRDVDAASMLSRLGEVRYGWIILALCLTLISHVVRAFRWNLLLKPLGYRHLSTFRTFLAVMVGYFANLIIPRMGEVTRCGLLQRTDNVPLSTSLGSVVAERVIDMLSLLAATILLFVLEFDRLNEFIISFFEQKAGSLEKSLNIIYFILGSGVLLTVLAVLLIRRYWHVLNRYAFFQKVVSFAKEVLKGISSIAEVEYKLWFILSTVGIWVGYFFMSYVVFFALPETAGLDWRAGFAVLVMGSLGMSAPVQGGIGTYHALVSGVLLLYGISEADGVLFATLVHGMQTIAVIIFGGICFLIASIIASRKPVVTAESKAAQ